MAFINQDDTKMRATAMLPSAESKGSTISSISGHLTAQFMRYQVQKSAGTKAQFWAFPATEAACRQFQSSQKPLLAFYIL